MPPFQTLQDTLNGIYERLGGSSAQQLAPQQAQSAFVIKTIVVPVPAAGANWIVSIPAGVFWRLKSVSCYFTASSAALNRSIVLLFQEGQTGITMILVPANTVVTANQVAELTWATGLNAVSLTQSATATFQSSGLPDVTMDFDHLRTLQGDATAVDAADQFSSIYLTVVEYMKSS
jgi:hypothetical protein